MKPAVTKLCIAFAITITLALNATGQVNYGMYINAGKSKLQQHGDEFANQFYWSSAHSIDFFVREGLRNSSISLQQGVVLGNYSTLVTLPEDMRDTGEEPFEWTDRIYYAGIPIGINYHPEKWFTLNFGFVNNFKLKSENDSKSTKNYVLRTYTGFEFTIFKKVLLGCQYSYSLTPDHQWIYKPDKTNHNYHVISGKVGYLFR